MPSSPSTTPAWMPRVLLAAGIYNVLWGWWAVGWPNALFAWAGMPLPNYPALWQCIGMLVGVYGIGYALAALDPARFWPLVLVGLLGKIFGPMGMAINWWLGVFPAAFTLTCLPNDILWWLPFGLILRHAWQRFRDESQASLPETAAILRGTHTSSGQSLAELSQDQPVLLVMLRHEGCTFCRNAMSDISRLRPRIENAGTRIVLGHMSGKAEFAAFASRYALESLPAVADPERVLYRSLGLKRARLSQLIGPRVLWNWLLTTLRGHGAGAIKGDAAQMPGAFLLHHGQVVKRYEYRDASDKPDYVLLASLPG